MIVFLYNSKAVSYILLILEYHRYYKVLMQLWMYNNPKNTRTQKLSFIQNRVKLNGSAKSQLFLKISKEKYFMHLTLYDLIFQTYKKFKLFYFFGTP